MESNLNDFIVAELIKQKVPMDLVLEEKDADYILTGLSQKTEVQMVRRRQRLRSGGKVRLEAPAKLIHVKDRNLTEPLGGRVR